MKVNLLGNTCNGQYFIAKALRALGVDAHLFYNSGLDSQTLPESQDPEVAHNRPEWLHPYTQEDVGAHPWLEAGAGLMRQISDCDIIQAEDVGVVWAMQSGRPYIWYPYGYDIHFYPFHSYWRAHWSSSNPEHFFAPLMFRRAIAFSSAFVNGLWVKELSECYTLVKELVGEERFLTTIPVGTDTNRFTPGASATAQELLRALGIDHKVSGMVIFHPTRMMFTPESYCQKGNDKLLYACGKLKEFGREFTLVLVRKGNPDEAVAEELIRKLNIVDNVVWIPKMTHSEIIPWYRASDVTVDEFSTGAMGSISAETMACGTPQLTYFETQPIDPTFWPPTQLFSSLPPIINAKEIDEIFSALLFYSHRPEELRALRQRSRGWVEDNMSGAVIGKKWQAMYADILAGRRGKIHNPKERSAISFLRNNQQRQLEAEISAASEALGRGALGQGLEALTRALDINPEDPNLNAAMINLFATAGNSIFAAQVAQLAVQLLPQNTALSQLSSDLGAAASGVR